MGKYLFRLIEHLYHTQTNQHEENFQRKKVKSELIIQQKKDKVPLKGKKVVQRFIVRGYPGIIDQTKEWRGPPHSILSSSPPPLTFRDCLGCVKPFYTKPMLLLLDDTTFNLVQLSSLFHLNNQTRLHIYWTKGWDSVRINTRIPAGDRRTCGTFQDSLGSLVNPF